MAESSPTDDGSKYKGSEITFDIVCVTCNTGQRIQKAEGYCFDCKEHLCSSCVDYHRISSATKLHKITAKEDTERCPIHPDEIITYFCRNHKVLCCNTCVTLNHKNCNTKQITYIPDAAANLSNSQELKDFQNKLEKLIEKSNYIKRAVQNNIRLYRAKAVQEIETYRQELNNKLDKLKIELENQSERIYKEDKASMGSSEDTSNQVLAELQLMSSDIKNLLDKKQHCKLFLKMKRAEDELKTIQGRLAKAENISVTAVRFQPNLELQKLIQEKDAFENLVVKCPAKMNATFLTEISVKFHEMLGYFIHEPCNVNAIAQLDVDRLVIVDEGKKSVKLVDTEHKQIISEYEMKTPPSDVAIVDKTLVAVTLPDEKKIQFLKVEMELRLDKEITFDKECWGVAYVDNTLVVSFSKPQKIKLLNMAGEVLQTFATSRQGDRLFSRAPYVTVSSFNQAIYASDWKKNRVTMFDMEGNVKAVYEDADLKKPRHTVVDETGMVYICGSGSNNIHLLTPDLRKVKILLSLPDGLWNDWQPRGICYCDVKKRLYVTMEDSSKLKVFQLS